jgi:hypothetical protein
VLRFIGNDDDSHDDRRTKGCRQGFESGFCRLNLCHVTERKDGRGRLALVVVGFPVGSFCGFAGMSVIMVGEVDVGVEETKALTKMKVDGVERGQQSVTRDQRRCDGEHQDFRRSACRVSLHRLSHIIAPPTVATSASW